MDINLQRKLQAIQGSGRAVIFITQQTSSDMICASPNTACITYEQDIVTDIRSNGDGDNLEASVISQTGSPESQCFDYSFTPLKDVTEYQIAVYILNEDWSDIQLDKEGRFS
jgi:hypothetical protein